MYGASTGEYRGTLTDDHVQAMLHDSAFGAGAVGVLVEPDPLNFGILKKNMKEFPHLTLFSGVVSNECKTPKVEFHALSPQFIKDEPGAAHHQIYQIGSLSEAAFKQAFWCN